MLRHGLVLLLIATPACKGKKKGDEPTTTGSGSGSGSSEPTKKNPSDVPAPAKGKPLDGMKFLAVGDDHGCAANEGSVWCWKAGEGATSYPAPSGTVVIALASNCALLDSGDLWCWPPNEMKVPANVQSGGQITASGDEVCVGHRMDIKCWKAGNPEPHAVWGWAGVDRIAMDGKKVCSNISGGGVECSDISQAKPTHDPVKGFDHTYDSLAMAGGLTCGLLENSGEVECWTEQQINKIAGIKKASALTVGASGHACVIVDNAVTCWKGTEPPKQVAGISNPQAVSAGASFGCALDGNGKVLCWGPGMSEDPNKAQPVARK